MIENAEPPVDVIWEPVENISRYRPDATYLLRVIPEKVISTIQ